MKKIAFEYWLRKKKRKLSKPAVDALDKETLNQSIRVPTLPNRK